MNSGAALQACMQGLVLLNLVFVHLTGASEFQWLLPLFALTLAAPKLARFRTKFLYRQLWNLGAVAFLGLMLSHALSGNLAYVLQDGLILAALCQVHLLNNLRSQQQPDLLFFNAFLIAIVTGYLTRDLGFAVAFLTFAPFYVVGLQLLCATRGGFELDRHDTRRLVRDGCRRATLLLVLSLVAFVAWPRDFDRKPFFADKLDLGGGADTLEIGFSETLDLERRGKVAQNDRPVLRATLRSGTPAQVPELWRGAALAEVSDGSWAQAAAQTNGPFEHAWRIDGRRASSGAENAPVSSPVKLTIERLDARTRRLFMPLNAREMRLDGQHRRGTLSTGPGATLEYSLPGTLGYELTLEAAPAAPLGSASDRASDAAFELESNRALQPYLELPESRAHEPAVALAELLARRLPEGATQRETVELFAKHLEQTYSYAPPGADGAAHNLQQFLNAHLPGHCELFASALACMLRSRGVPARIATGYRGGTWDERGRVLTLSATDAHAWVEVADAERGWIAVDPAPLPATLDLRPSLFARARAGIGTAWSQLTGFDAERRAQLFASLRDAPRRALAGLREHPARLLLLAPPIGLLVWLRRRRSGRRPAPVLAYHRTLRQLGLELAPGMTPLQLLERVEAEPEAGAGAGAELERLRAATAAHESQRYAA